MTPAAPLPNGGNGDDAVLRRLELVAAMQAATLLSLQRLVDAGYPKAKRILSRHTGKRRRRRPDAAELHHLIDQAFPEVSP